jgi:transcriptional regulator with XRE-family HTH domain
MKNSLALAVQEATDLACMHHQEIAAEVGITPAALLHWRAGRRKPTTQNLAALGRVLLGRARRIESAASNLIRLADQNGRRADAGELPGVDTETLDMFPDLDPIE